MSPPVLLEARGLAKSFPGRRGRREVLAEIALTVDRGEFVAILGPMGSGKSTLLALLGGLTRPDQGIVTIGGEDVRGIGPRGAFVFQNYSLLPWFSALENVRLAVGAAFPRVPRSEQRQRAARALEQVGLGHALHRRPGQLSGGMRQRVAIARALAVEPQILFLDEPFSALDALTRETLQQELVRLCSSLARPVTVVMVTNNVDEAILLSDRILPLTRGPRATLRPAIPVTLTRPRSLEQLAQDEAALRVRARVIETLMEGMTPASGSSAKPPNRPPHPRPAAVGPVSQSTP
jgi:nitrate/nitrite transport system ATP-binding protein